MTVSRIDEVLARLHGELVAHRVMLDVAQASKDAASIYRWTEVVQATEGALHQLELRRRRTVKKGARPTLRTAA